MALGKKRRGEDNLPFKSGALLLRVEDVKLDDNKIIVICDQDVTFSIKVKNEIALSKDKTKTKFVNDFGKFYYAEDKENLPAYFKTEQTRPSFVGESMLVGLIINANDMESDADFMINTKKLLRQKDVSEIRSFLLETQFVAWGTQYNGEQSVFYEFLPAETFDQLDSDNPKTDKVKAWLKNANT